MPDRCSELKKRVYRVCFSLTRAVALQKRPNAAKSDLTIPIRNFGLIMQNIVDFGTMLGECAQKKVVVRDTKTYSEKTISD